MSGNLGSPQNMIIAKGHHDGVEVYNGATRTRQEALSLCNAYWRDDYETVAFVEIRNGGAVVELLKGTIGDVVNALNSRFSWEQVASSDLQPATVSVNA